MKKRIAVILSILLVIATATTVFAMYIDDPYAQKLLEQGYTEEDIWSLNAIFLYSDVRVTKLIVQRYEELGDWEKVREYYNVDKEQYDNYIVGQQRWKDVLDAIPDTVMNGMKAEGWSQREINDFVNKINIHEIDSEYAWGEYKSGKTIDEIVQLKETEDKAISELTTKFVVSEMTIEEYESALSKLTTANSITIGEILSEVKTLRTDVRNRHKLQSGITDKEIVYCMKNGMTNPMDMFQAKYFSKGNNVPFEDVVSTKLQHTDWISTAAEILNIPLEEYQKQVQQALSE